MPDNHLLPVLFTFEFAYLDIYTLYYFGVFCTKVTGNILFFVVALYTDIPQALLTLVLIGCWIVGTIASVILFNQLCSNKKQSLFLLCLLGIISATAQIMFIQFDGKNLSEFMISTTAFVAAMKCNWSVKYCNPFVPFGISSIIEKMFTYLIEFTYYPTAAMNDDNNETTMKEKGICYIQILCFISFLLAAFFSLLMVYLVGYYALLILIILLVYEMVIYGENIFVCKCNYFVTNSSSDGTVEAATTAAIGAANIVHTEKIMNDANVGNWVGDMKMTKELSIHEETFNSIH